MKTITMTLTAFVAAASMYAADTTDGKDRGAVAKPPQVRSVPIPAPTREVYLQALRREHPRLLITAADVPRIKQLVQDDALAKAMYEQVKKKADATLTEPVSVYEIPDGLRLLATSRRVLSRTYTLGLVWLVSGEARYRDRLWRELEAAGGFKDWNPKHYLDTAEMMHAFAIAYDWLYAEWTEPERKLLRDAMLEKGLKLSDAQFKKGGWWVKGGNNWNFVCSGGSAMAALALLDEEPDLCAAVLAGAFESIQPTLFKFEPDGNWYEGPGYWHYSIKYLVPHITALETALGTEFGLMAAFPGFMKTADFPIYCTGPGGTFNFADAGGAGGVFKAPEFFWFSAKTGNPLYAWYEASHPAGAAEDILYYRPGTAASGMPDIPLDRRFRGDEAEVVTLRSSWDNATAVFAALKAGRNGVSHAHIDLGSFVVDAAGTRFIEDLGADNYNMPAYFGNQRWTYYRLRAEGHNTLLVNPGNGPDQNVKALAAITHFESDAGRAMVGVDLTQAYPDAERVQRELRLEENRGTVRVCDQIRLKKPSQAWWFAHTKASVVLKPDGRTAILTRGAARFEARLETPPEARFTVMDAVPLPSSPNPDMQNQNKGIRKLAIRFDDLSEADVTVAFRAVPPPRLGVLPRAQLAGAVPDLDAAITAQAEAFTAQQGGTVELVSKTGDTGGSFKLWDSQGHTLTWTFDVPADGTYGVLMRYCTETAAVGRTVLVDGREIPPPDDAFYFGSTGGWSNGRDDWQDVWLAGADGAVRLELQRGPHTLTLVNANGTGLNLDWLRLVPLR